VIRNPLRRNTDDTEPPPAADEAAARPGRLQLRRQLLLWSTPALVVLLVLAIKLISVGVLGDRLPGQFAGRDGDAMTSTLEWIDFGKPGRGYREELADGDRALLKSDLPGALRHFKAAFDEEPACPPRANFALTSETMSDTEVRKGNFANARKLLEPALAAANGDMWCFTTSTASSEKVRKVVQQTPRRLANKLAALKAGRLTKTANGYDYQRNPNGEVDLPPTDSSGQCPGDDDAAQRDCIGKKDAERQAQQQTQTPQGSEPVPAPGTDPGPGVAPSDKPGNDFPDPSRQSPVPFCTPTPDDPLHNLGVEMCWTAGPWSWAHDPLPPVN
jgi:hypothetical protein